MKTAVFLYNPESGKGKIARNVGCISTIFQAYGYDVTPQRSVHDIVPDFGCSAWQGECRKFGYRE